MDAAILAGNYLLKLLALQPKGTRVFYYNFDSEKKALVTEVVPGRAIDTVVDPAKPRQHFIHVGSEMGFLADLYLASEDKGYLEGAMGYFDWSRRICEEGYSWPSMCKNGWGAALLFSVTRKPECRQHAEMILQKTFLAAQGADGSWPAFRFLLTDDGSENIPLSAEEMTAEFTYELLEIVKGLARMTPDGG